MVRDFTELVKAIPRPNFAGPGEELLGGAQFGIRKRRSIKEAAYPFSAIGKVAREGAKKGLNCTGTLVGPCQVVTASHCVRYENGTLHPMSFQVFGEKRDIRVKDVVRGAYQKKAENTEEDWAILILDQSVSKEQRWLDLYEGAPQDYKSSNLMIAGYSGLNPDDRPTVDAGVSILGREREGKVLLTNFSASGGDSGSGLLIYDPLAKVYRVAALTSYSWYGNFSEKDAAHGTKMVSSSNFFAQVETARKRDCGP